MLRIKYKFLNVIRHVQIWHYMAAENFVFMQIQKLL